HMAPTLPGKVGCCNGSQRLAHFYDWQHQPIPQRNVDLLFGKKPMGPIQAQSRQGRSEFQPSKSLSRRRSLAGFHHQAANAPALPPWLHKECTNAGCVPGRIEQCVFSVCVLVTAEESAPPAPASTSDDLSRVFHRIVRTIADELSIDPEYRPQCRLALLRRVV